MSTPLPAPVAVGVDRRRWQAVRARDTRWDGQFVYAVRSTQIYCRPSCPSRRPRRATVAFFPSPLAAEQAGFRACRRCRPQQAVADPARLALVRRVCTLLDAAARPLSLGALGRGLGTSADRLRRAFAAVTGLTPRQYFEGRRAERLRRDLRAGTGVNRALYAAGYGSPSRVYGRNMLGMTPATYARGGRGAVIGYTTAPTAYGRLLIAATSRGICRVSLGANDAELVADLRREYPDARQRRDDAPLRPLVRRVLRGLDGRPRAELPLDVRATAFQWRVWTALRRIPVGETRSYQEIAREVGRARATRAVARACAANPVALVIPCHRVVRADGALGGYRWGVARKAQLLAHERAGAR